MNIENNIKRICRLIIRSMDFPLSSEEEQELARWREESARHEELYRKLTGWHFQDEDYARYEWVRRQDDWNMLQRRIRVRRARKYFSIRYLSRYAVALVVGVFAAYFLRTESQSHKETNVVPRIEILPGHPVAILEVENGERILLGKERAEDSILLIKHGIMEKEKTIVYLQKDSIAVKQHTLRVPRGGEYVLTLADGSRVWVNSESVLHYPSRFDGTERRVSVTGEAYFQIAKNSECPFIAEVCGMEVRVTGTEFNVMAYRDKAYVETTLVSGGITVKAGDREKKIFPGMQAVFSKENGEISTRRVNTELYTSWKEGIFEFRDLPLRDIALQLGRWYDADFRFEDDEVAAIRFTGAAKKTNAITFILDVIKETKAVDYRIEGKTIVMEKR